jgi:hypothetical protein
VIFVTRAPHPLIEELTPVHSFLDEWEEDAILLVRRIEERADVLVLHERLAGDVDWTGRRLSGRCLPG